MTKYTYRRRLPRSITNYGFIIYTQGPLLDQLGLLYIYIYIYRICLLHTAGCTRASWHGTRLEALRRLFSPTILRRLRASRGFAMDRRRDPAIAHRLHRLVHLAGRAPTGADSAVLDSGMTIDNTLLRELTVDDLDGGDPTVAYVRVRGHAVRVTPTPVDSPHIVAFEDGVADLVGLAPGFGVAHPEVLAGNVLVEGMDPFATAYAVSVYGTYVTPDDVAYGDGRAASLCEVVNSSGERYELQLKGSGPTPFCRGADGRAVLRSSVREFLVSEAMHNLGVPTTRALSLIAHDEEIERPWYDATSENPEQGTSPEVMAASPEGHAPFRMQTETGAIMCRVSPSFLRVGHLELFFRRAVAGEGIGELQQMCEHVLRREFSEIWEDTGSPTLAAKLVLMVEEFAKRQAMLVAEWLRVGYVQGNMNSDNCTLGGRTIDYGPFGIMERYDGMWNPFTSDPEGKFAFVRQPGAARVNLSTLAQIVVAMLGPEGQNDELKARVNTAVEDCFAEVFFATHHEHNRAKLGVTAWDENAEELWDALQGLMQTTGEGVDFTLLYRQLGSFDTPAVGDETAAGVVVEEALAGVFYVALHSETKPQWASWCAKYAARLIADGRDSAERRAEQCATSPKFVARNWMLVTAYEAAYDGDYSVIAELQELLRSPYDEQSEAMSKKYYRKTPAWAQEMPGVKFMS